MCLHIFLYLCSLSSVTLSPSILRKKSKCDHNSGTYRCHVRCYWLLLSCPQYYCNILYGQLGKRQTRYIYTIHMPVDPPSVVSFLVDRGRRKHTVYMYIIIIFYVILSFCYSRTLRNNFLVISHFVLDLITEHLSTHIRMTRSYIIIFLSLLLNKM